MTISLIIILLEGIWREDESEGREGHLAGDISPVAGAQGQLWSLEGSTGSAARRCARVPVVDQALSLRIVHRLVALAQAQAHHIVVNVVPCLFAVEAPGEVVVCCTELF